MAYTIIEVEKLTGVSSYTLRFWAKKGLFPFIERDKNGVKYFSDSDVRWVEWIVWLRETDMSLEDIKRYAELLAQGFNTAKERKALLDKALKKLKAKVARLGVVAEHLEIKIAKYDESIARGVDLFNVQSADYKDCKEAIKDKRKKK